MPQASHRDQLLQSAIDCLQTKGYARTTARDIATGASANTASIGYHFGSKEDLLTEALIRISGEWFVRLSGLAGGPAGLAPMDRLVAAFASMAEGLEANRPVLAAFAEAFAEVDRAPELRASLATHYETTRNQLAALIIAGLEGADTALTTESARNAASAIIALCDGYLQQWRVDPERTPDGAVLLQALTQVLVAVAGFRPGRS